LSGEQAEVTITYYPDVDDDSGSSQVSDTITIPGNDSVTLTSFGGDFPDGVQPGFAGSVVIQSTQEVEAIVNLLSADFQQGASYPGFRGGDTTVNLPLITRQNPGVGGNPVSTSINVQNASSESVSVDIAYTPNPGEGNGQAGSEDTFTLGVGEQKTFVQADKTEIGDATTGKFVGGAVVTATGPVVVTVESEGASQLLAYSGFPANQVTNTSVAPLIVANNDGNFTGLQVQNAGTQPTDVTVTYGPNGATGDEPPGGFCPTPEARTVESLAAGATVTLLQLGLDATAGFDPATGFDGQFTECTYVGSATVTSNQPVVSIVNQVTSPSLQASAYEGFADTSASIDTRAPLVFGNNSGLISSVQVQNNGNTADVTVTYGPNTYTQDATNPNALPACAQPDPVTQNVPGGSSTTFFQWGPTADATFPFNGQFAGCTYVGSATVSSASPVVAIVNQVSITSTANDSLTTYNAFNQQ
jgi:hypothetical protein